MRFLRLLLLASLPLSAWAAPVPPATVQAVQAPAWRERAGRAQPLAVGMAVQDGDQLRTGDGARAYVQLADGSVVKLGEDARLDLFSRSLTPRTHFRGALDVLAGAFRYTTDALRRVRGRELAIRVGTATAGIRGTDLWGKSDAEKDLICLIDGHIQVSHGGETVHMAQPLSFFVAPKGQAAKPVAAVEPEQLRQWAQETDIAPAAGASRRGGRWKLLAGHAESEEEALALYDAMREAGFDARVRPVAAEKAGAWAYDLLLTGFPSEADAAAAALRLKGKTGLAANPRR